MVEKILDGIKSSPLRIEIKEKAMEVIRNNPRPLEAMFESLSYKSLSALPDWYHDITRTAMSMITPTLQENSVPVKVGRKVYDHIYSAISE